MIFPALVAPRAVSGRVAARSGNDGGWVVDLLVAILASDEPS